MALVFLGLGVMLGVLNPTPVQVDFFFQQHTFPLSVVLSVSFVIGLLFAGFFMSIQLVKAKWAIRKLNKEIKKQTNEIIELQKKLHLAERTAESLPSANSTNPSS
jgi:uncharacterized integral membrane protein